MLQWYQRTLLGVSLIMLLWIVVSAEAVEVFKVSKFNGAVQIWFEAEAFDAREPDDDKFFPIAGEENNTPDPPKGVFGKAITRTGGAGVPPFLNEDDRIFEADVGAWGWDGGAREGHKKELQDGENTMHIFHRQGNTSRLMDVFVWTDNSGYRPTDEDYEKAKEIVANQAVDPAGKLATVWGEMKSHTHQ